MKGGDTLGRNPTPVVHVRCSRPQLVIAGFLTHQTMPFRSGKKILKSSPDHSYNIYIYHKIYEIEFSPAHYIQ